MPNLPTDSSKKTADSRGVGVKNREKFADVLNGWSNSIYFFVNLGSPCSCTFAIAKLSLQYV